MISLYSGTPGSGKSLDICRLIYMRLKYGRPVVCNFPIATDRIRSHHLGDFQLIEDADLSPAALVKYAKQKPRKEEEILLVIDEAQTIFNAREWGRSDRSEWNKFFTQHRKLGYDVILIAQFDAMLDKQIRALIEYEYKHRKVTNLGWRGWLIRPFVGSFAKVQIWYPMKEKVGLTFFRFSHKYASLYDTNALFNIYQEEEEAAETKAEEKQEGNLEVSSIERKGSQDEVREPSEIRSNFQPVTTIE